MGKAKKVIESGIFVKSEFRDIDDFDLKHEVGSDVSHFDAVRIAKLEEMGLIERRGEEEKTSDED